MPFLMKIWLFISIKEEEKHLIWPSQCKYAFLDVYPRGSAAVNMFSISNFSEFGPRGGGRNFSIISEIQKVLNYPRGGGGGKDFFSPSWDGGKNFFSCREGGGIKTFFFLWKLFSIFLTWIQISNRNGSWRLQYTFLGIDIYIYRTVS